MRVAHLTILGPRKEKNVGFLQFSQLDSAFLPGGDNRPPGWVKMAERPLSTPGGGVKTPDRTLPHPHRKYTSEVMIYELGRDGQRKHSEKIFLEKYFSYSEFRSYTDGRANPLMRFLVLGKQPESGSVCVAKIFNKCFTFVSPHQGGPSPPGVWLRDCPSPARNEVHRKRSV